MIENFVKGRTDVFIDASNVYHSYKTLGWKIDYVKLKSYLERDTDLGRIYFYTAYDPEYPKQRKFLDFLEMTGYFVRKKEVKFIKDRQSERGGFHKGNLDVELTIDAVDQKDQFQSFVLFSGDSDFAALLRYMRERSKNCVVVSSKDHVSVELLRQAKYIDLKRLEKDIAAGGLHKKESP